MVVPRDLLIEYAPEAKSVGQAGLMPRESLQKGGQQMTAMHSGSVSESLRGNIHMVTNYFLSARCGEGEFMKRSNRLPKWRRNAMKRAQL